MPSAPGPETTGFHRDPMTIAFYGSFIIWGWLLYSFNPSVPLLADELGISAAQAGLHGTAMAAGAIIASLLTPWLVRTRGRRDAIVAACGFVTVGALGLALAPALAWSLAAMVAASVGGNVAISSAQAGLAVRHGSKASAAVTEGNGVGSSVGLLGPLAVGAFVALGWGWRPGVAVTAVLAIATAVVVARIPVGGAMTPPQVAVAGTRERAARTGTSLPARIFVVTLVAAVSLEFATTYWATGLVIEQTGAGPGIAAATTAGLVAGMSAIRFVVGPLSLRVAPFALLAVAFLVAIGGWAILWTATSPTVAIVGLVVAGIGYGAQYPLAISLLLATAPGRADAMQARATLVGGLAIGVAPFALGALSDAVGTHRAFLVVPVVALVGAVAAVLGGRASGRGPAPVAPELSVAAGR
ncbi:MFS transporter [Cellulomonas fengjieae]|uniref:MFS transporter n=1 Tax=Cellulomonas fengjieae TaxID=2819978 RepID=A0ABS3SJF5_9CELL|nr:MFS transporter [Cellulomonas fengjieae]MBO3085882.1 MFS transporter [Cellulomonas fengjieae]MBO3102991.1 MFS transporter [Cellulomonas fengjieae]QVI67423.1 MFS transporter [Cellulomonas fengjieae]